MAGDRRDYFGRVPKRPAPDTRDRRSGLGGADGMPEEIRKRREANENIRKMFGGMRDRGFGMTINMSKDATPDQRKAAFDRLLEERRGSMRPFPKRNQDQNIARTDI